MGLSIRQRRFVKRMLERDEGATVREIWSALEEKAGDPPPGLSSNDVCASWGDIEAFVRKVGFIPEERNRRNDHWVFHPKRFEKQMRKPPQWQIEAYMISMMRRRRGATCWEMADRIGNRFDIEPDVDEILSFAGEYGHIPDPDEDYNVYDQVFVWGKPKRKRQRRNRRVSATPRRQQGKVTSFAFTVQEQLFELEDD